MGSNSGTSASFALETIKVEPIEDENIELENNLFNDIENAETDGIKIESHDEENQDIKIENDSMDLVEDSEYMDTSNNTSMNVKTETEFTIFENIEVPEEKNTAGNYFLLTLFQFQNH